jgi:hypothetical protein
MGGVAKLVEGLVAKLEEGWWLSWKGDGWL